MSFQKLINNQHRHAKYDWYTFKMALHNEFKKDNYTNYTFDKEISLEEQLWQAFFNLKIGEPLFHKTFLYLQYSIMLEQRPIFSDHQIDLTYHEKQAQRYSIKKLKLLCKKGLRDVVTDAINEILRKHPEHRISQNTLSNNSLVHQEKLSHFK